MKIKMLETRRVSENGFGVRRLEKGNTYDLADSCARHVLNQGWAFNAELEDDQIERAKQTAHDVAATMNANGMQAVVVHTSDTDALFDIFMESVRPPTREQLERILRPVACNPATRGDVA